MTARYHASTNELEELPGMEKPFPIPDYMDYKHGLNRYGREVAQYNQSLAKYNAHISSLRRIPCDKNTWADQQLLTEGKDYEIRYVCNKTGDFSAGCMNPSCEYCSLTAFSITEPVQHSPDLPITEALEVEAEELYPYHPQNDEMYTDSMVTNIQRSAHITCAEKYISRCAEMGELLMSKDGEIEALKNDVEGLRKENEALREEIECWKDELKEQVREHRNNQ